MEDFRSKSCRDGGMQMEVYHGDTAVATGPASMQDLRCYSANYAHPNQVGKGVRMKKNKSTFGSSSAKSWSLSDPELQRKKRVAGYKIYAVEGKMKGSFRKNFRWIKDTWTQLIYGWR